MKETFEHAGSGLTALMASLPRNNNVRFGDAFELVSTYALKRSVDFGNEIDTIERFEPYAIRVGISHRDLGVDQIITTINGEIWAVQNKGRASADGSVKLEEMSNFVLAAKAVPGVKRLLLVTSGRGLTANAAQINRESDSRVVVLNLEWLEKATTYPKTLKDLRKNSGEAVEILPPYVLRDDQLTAVHNISRQLRKHAETQFIAACGSGKTVTSHAIATALGAKNIVFFVPSLGLMRQTIRSWRRQMGATGMHAIAVCSDNTVGDNKDDHAVWNDEDIPCEVVRDSEQVAEYIKSHTGPEQTAPVVVFVTYHSDHRVIDAQHLYGAPEFDFAFMDEAHTLVATEKDGGRRGERVKRKDDGARRLLARHRVYATATPRSVSTRSQKRLAAIGATELDSMDAGSTVFGPVAYQLTFGEAITLGILCDYEVSIIATKTQDHADFIAERAYVLKDGDTVMDAQTFATIEAVKHIHAAGARRMFMYMNRKDTARQIAECINGEPGLPGADHVLGDMPVKQREVNINKLYRPEGHILTNVRCLNEGVDVPSLDAVIFTDPKSSPVDLAQAVGRVLRTAPGKTKGHIVIPVAVSAEDWESGTLTDDERDEAMSGPSPYRAIFDIIEALSSHDETIRHILTALRLGLGNRKNTSGVDDEELPDTPAELEEYIRSLLDDEGRLAREDGAPLSAIASSVLGGGKVVLIAPGMTAEMRQKFAASLRLATVRESGRSGFTMDDHMYNTLVYGYGKTWPEAEKSVRDARERLAFEGVPA
jgi:predicted helicase